LELPPIEVGNPATALDRAVPAKIVLLTAVFLFLVIPCRSFPQRKDRARDRPLEPFYLVYLNPVNFMNIFDLSIAEK
jgi:hypothetical protein